MTGVSSERQGEVRVLYLDRPPANTLDFALLEALGREAEAAAADPDVRAVVLASRQEKYFSAGLDPEALSVPTAEERLELFKRLIGTHRALAGCPKPTFAALRGSALLGGFILALGCDFRYIGAETGKVSLSEVRLGLSPTRALIRLVASLGTRQEAVKRLVLGGQTLGAREAFEAGLADRLLPDGEVLAECVRDAAKLAKLPPGAFASVKRDYREALAPDSLWEPSLAEFRRLLEGDEAREGLAAVVEKRRPRWR